MGWVVSTTPRPLHPRETDPVPIIKETACGLGTETLAATEFDSRTVQPVPSVCTGYAIPASLLVIVSN